MARLHEAVEEGSDAFFGELRVRHSDQSIELAIEDGVVHDHAESPVRNDELVLKIVRGPHQNLILHEVASDLTASKTDLDPVLLVGLRLSEAR